MAERIRFHLDEHIDSAVARALRRHVIDVTTTKEVGLRTESDEVQLNFVQTERRVMVTRDRDFLRLAAQTGSHPGIVFCTKTHPVGDIVRALILIYEVLSAEELANRIEYI